MSLARLAVRNLWRSPRRTVLTGVAIFAGVAATAGVLMRWLIYRDDVYDLSNVHFANFLIGAGSLVALGVLLTVAKALVSIPKPPAS